MRRLCLRSCRNESGSTLLEALVALAIVAIAVTAGFGLLSKSVSVFSRTTDDLWASTKIIDLDRTVRALAFRVKPPFWIRSFKAVTVDGGVSLPYFDGKADSVLTIRVSEQGLKLEVADMTQTIKGVTDAKVDIVDGGEGRPTAIVVTGMLGRDVLDIKAPLGAWPVGVSE